MSSWDVIVVGGGMAGLATAYHLARSGASTLVLQANELGGGTSAACSGRAQVSEGHLDPLNLRLIRDGLALLDTLEEELGCYFECRRVPYLCLIRTPALWNDWVKRASILTSAGLPTEMLDVDGLRLAEPLLSTAGSLGAAYSMERLLNPFLFCHAYARAARRLGAILHSHMPVTGMVVEGRRVVAVVAGTERFSAGQVAVLCGAWTPHVTRLAGVEVPIRHTHAEAFVTEPLPAQLALHHTIGLADFYETIHGREQAVSIGCSPEPNGALVVTEAVARTDQIHTRCSSWGLPGMAAELAQLIPRLAPVRALRAWAIPTPFTPDEDPIIGWLPERDNLFVAASFLLTITALPLLSEWLARLLLGERLDLSLERYSPARFASGEGFAQN